MRGIARIALLLFLGATLPNAATAAERDHSDPCQMLQAEKTALQRCYAKCIKYKNGKFTNISVIERDTCEDVIRNYGTKEMAKACSSSSCLMRFRIYDLARNIFHPSSGYRLLETRREADVNNELGEIFTVIDSAGQRSVFIQDRPGSFPVYSSGSLKGAKMYFAGEDVILQIPGR